MGTLGDRVGLDLMALFGSEEDQVQLDADSPSDQKPAPVDAADTVSDVGAGSSDLDPDVSDSFVDAASSLDGKPPVEQVVRKLISELSGADAATLDLDQALSGAIDISGLALWAVVAEVERVSERTFPDSMVAAWHTPRDIIDAAESLEQ